MVPYIPQKSQWYIIYPALVGNVRSQAPSLSPPPTAFGYNSSFFRQIIYCPILFRKKRTTNTDKRVAQEFMEARLLKIIICIKDLKASISNIRCCIKNLANIGL